jgi:hypothetical protein
MVSTNTCINLLSWKAVSQPAVCKLILNFKMRITINPEKKKEKPTNIWH